MRKWTYHNKIVKYFLLILQTLNEKKQRNNNNYYKHMDIYIGNLPQNLDEGHLKILFEPFGDIISATVVKDNVTGRCKGFGFVKMHHAIDAQRAIDDMNGRELAGKSLIVMEANTNNSKTNPLLEENSEGNTTSRIPKRRIFGEEKWNNSSNFNNTSYQEERIDLEVKDETEFSKETLKNGFVQIRFKK